MKDKYNRTLWIDCKTKLDAAKLNNIEEGIENLFENALTASEIYGGDGIQIDIVHDKEIYIHTAQGYYMTAEEVTNAIAQAQLTGPDGSIVIDLSGKADKTHTHTISDVEGLREALQNAGVTQEQLEQYINSKGYATTSYVTEAIAQAKLDGSDIDLSGKANVGDSYLKAESDAKYQPKGNYLTEHQSLANYFTKTESDSRYQSKGNYLTNSSLANYLTATESDSRYQSKGDYVTMSSMSNYLTKTESDAKYQPKGNYLTEHQSLDNYFTKLESESKYQPKGNYLTETQSDTRYQPKGNYLTETQTDARYQPKGNYLTEHQSLENYFSKGQSDDRYQLKTDAQLLVQQISLLNDVISNLSYRVSVLENGPSIDTIELVGTISYPYYAPAAGGTITPTNTLRLLKNGVEQDNVEFVYSINQSYATVDTDGTVTFQASTVTEIRTATVTVTCIYDGNAYVKTASVTQSAFINIVLEGDFSYSDIIPAVGGTVIPTNTLKLTRNGVVQSVTISYSSNRDYAIVEPNGVVTFSESTTISQRTATITASCVYEGVTYTKTATVRQAAYVPDVIELTGTFKYTSTVLAAGGTVSPTNTLSLTKNGVAQDVVFTYSSNQSYATVNNSGVVTFTASESTSQRTATITASCTYNGQTYSKTATVTQEALVVPDAVYRVGYALNTAKDAQGRMEATSIGLFQEIRSTTDSTIDFTIGSKSNVVIVICPANKHLVSCVKQGAILDDITTNMTSPLPNWNSTGLVGGTSVETYNGETVNMYQFRYGGNLLDERFIAIFE